METNEKYQINYHGEVVNYNYHAKNNKRSIKQKLFIVLSFIFVLAVTPSIIYSLTNFDFNNNREVSVLTSDVEAPVINENKEPEVYKVFIEEPKTAENEVEIINNDSWWKISVRACGEGKYYLDLQEQNNAKALFEGNTVTVVCPSY
jgi:hypothetical protein